MKITDRPCQCFGYPINWIAEIGGYECGFCKARWPHLIDMVSQETELDRLRATLADRDAELAALRSDLEGIYTANTEYVNEIERLLAVALDLSKVPEGMAWCVQSLPDGNVMAIVGTPEKTAEAIADTPAAALAAAIERTR